MDSENSGVHFVSYSKESLLIMSISPWRREKVWYCLIFSSFTSL